MILTHTMIKELAEQRLACPRDLIPSEGCESGYFQSLEGRLGHGTERQVDRGDHRGFA